MSKMKVLIVGASIAGPTAAYWFAKTGATVTVIERFPQLRPGGQNIDIRTVGVTVMRKMAGMEAAVRSKLYHMDCWEIQDENGRPIVTIRPSGDPKQQSLISEYEIFRGDLARILFDLTNSNDNVKYIFGEQVASMQQTSDGAIIVEFANGSPTSEYDLVVAADGATSRTRALGFGCGVRDHITRLNLWAAYFGIDGDLLNGAHSAVRGRFMGCGPPQPSGGGNRITLMRVHPRNNQDATLPFRQAAERGTQALKEYVAEQFGDAGWKSGDIIKGMMKSEDFYASEIVQVKMPKLYNGRFVLVGDAGYAAGPTGTGTSLAMAGAYLLAGEVGKHKDNLAAGLKAYEERMAPLIKDMQKIPPGVPGVMAPWTAWGLWLRNTFLKIVAWGIAFSSYFAWLGRFLAGIWASSLGTDKYGLPDYDWVA